LYIFKKNAIFPCIHCLWALPLINVEAMIALEERVRSPVVGGMFYPDYKAEALACMRSYGLERGRGGYAQAIIAPHGAWEISGPLTGIAFAAAAGRTGGKSPSRVVIMGPIHDKREEGLFLSNSHSFQTPLGDIPVDEEISEAIESCSPLFEVNDIPHLREHSLEVLLPFVKYCFPRAAIVPILMGQPRAPVIAALAYALKIVIEPVLEDTLLVVSFNLAADSSKAMSRGMAEECMRLCAEKNAAAFKAAFLNGRINTCGGGLVASLLQSGLLDPMRAISQPLLRVNGEGNTTVYYGALSFA
jgi:AmmeMemoRadiSam system protein B